MSRVWVSRMSAPDPKGSFGAPMRAHDRKSIDGVERTVPARGTNATLMRAAGSGRAGEAGADSWKRLRLVGLAPVSYSHRLLAKPQKPVILDRGETDGSLFRYPAFRWWAVRCSL